MAARKKSTAAPSAEELELISDIGYAWRDIRRGGVNGPVRDRIYGKGDDAVDPRQMDLLDLLVIADRPRRMGDLATQLRIDPSTATRAIHRLVRNGLAEQVKVPGDARAVHIAPTKKGRAAHEVVFARRRALLLELVRSIEPEQRRDLVDNLQLFVHKIEEIIDSSTARGS
jgi:DNA-binding MarR family transcriptional regulator